MTRKKDGPLFKTPEKKEIKGASPDDIAGALMHLTARDHVLDVVRQAQTYTAPAEFENLQMETRQAAGALAAALSGSADPYAIASLTMDLCEAINSLNVSVTLTKPAMAGFGSMEGGHKGGLAAAEARHGTLHDDLVKKAQKLLRSGELPRSLVSECRRLGYSKLSARQTRTILQNAKLIPRKGK